MVWDFADVDRFSAGALGEPGQRVFYLQAVAGTEVATVRLEKTQVGALAEYLAQLLNDLPAPDVESVPGEVGLIEPVQEAWLVGQIGVDYDKARDRMMVRADELQVEEDEESTGGTMRVALTRGQVQAFVVHATVLVSAGRPPCPLCGRPIDPEGHMCIKTNGHKH